MQKRVYLIEGDPGSGKTTLGLQFLREGVARGESVLYVTLSKTKTELAGVAASHGWTLDGMTIHELTPSEESSKPDDQYTFFHPSEVELGETTKAVFAEVERINPSRVVFDSLSEMRLLAREPLRYRRQILALKQFFVGRNCTVLLLDDRTSQPGDLRSSWESAVDFGRDLFVDRVNRISAILAAATIAIYIFAYTPLKRVSTANTLVGAIPVRCRR